MNEIVRCINEELQSRLSKLASLKAETEPYHSGEKVKRKEQISELEKSIAFLRSMREKFELYIAGDGYSDPLTSVLFELTTLKQSVNFIRFNLKREDLKSKEEIVESVTMKQMIEGL
jgi:hypothetical protein